MAPLVLAGLVICTSKRACNTLPVFPHHVIWRQSRTAQSIQVQRITKVQILQWKPDVFCASVLSARQCCPASESILVHYSVSGFEICVKILLWAIAEKQAHPLIWKHAKSPRDCRQLYTRWHTLSLRGISQKIIYHGCQKVFTTNASKIGQ